MCQKTYLLLRLTDRFDDDHCRLPSLYVLYQFVCHSISFYYIIQCSFICLYYERTRNQLLFDLTYSWFHVRLGFLCHLVRIHMTMARAIEAKQKRFLCVSVCVVCNVYSIAYISRNNN